MTQCELLAACLFFNEKMATMPATASLMKQHYCRGNNLECARYQVYLKLGREKVPADLFPNEVNRVQHIISSES